MNKNMKFVARGVIIFLMLSISHAQITHEYVAHSYDMRNTHHNVHRIPHDVHPENNRSDGWLLKCIGVVAIFCTVAVVFYFAYHDHPLRKDLDEKYLAKLHTEPGKPLRFQNIDDEEKGIRFQNIDDEERGIPPIKSSLSTVGFFDI